MKKIIPFLVIGAGAVYFFRDKIFGSNDPSSNIEKSNTGSSSSGNKSPVVSSSEVKLTKSQKIRSMAVKGIEGLKYDYELVIQQNWGHGWDDVDFYECDSTGYIKKVGDRVLFQENKKAYRINQPTTPLRVIFRKSKKKLFV